MRIVVINNFFLPRPGGSSIFSYSMAREFIKSGHEVLVITAAYQNQSTVDEIEGIRVIRLPSWTLPATPWSFNFDINFGLVPGNQGRLAKLLREFQPDVVHCHGQFFDLTWKAIRWAKTAGVPVVLTLHTRLISPQRSANILFKFLDRYVVVPFLRRGRIDALVAIDKTFMTYIEERYRSLAKKIQTIPISVDFENFPKANVIRPSENGRLITSIGHVISVRNRLDLIRALPRVLEVFPDTRVQIVGRVYYPPFIQEIKRLQLEPVVELLGPVPKDRIPDILSKSSIEIHDTQGFGIGIATLEAMAMGIPAVISDDPDYFLIDSLKHLEDCFIVPSNSPKDLSDAILWFFNDAKRLDEVGAAGFEFVRGNLRQDLIATRYLRLFMDLL